MKSRNLEMIYDLIAANYTKNLQPNGKFLHTLTPSTTNTVYEFEANSTDEIVIGEHYNIGLAMSKNNHVSNRIKYYSLLLFPYQESSACEQSAVVPLVISALNRHTMRASTAMCILVLSPLLYAPYPDCHLPPLRHGDES